MTGLATSRMVNFVCPAIIDNHDMPKAIFGVMPPLQDGFAVKSDFASCFVEK
jgi:hypothetical protein